MDNGENTTKKKTFKLTKVNSRDGSNVVYDAYGYEIKTGDRPRSESPRSNAAEADGPVPEPARRAAAETERDDPELLRTERRTYNADIRAAIESGAHRRTHDPADSVTGDRPRSGYDSVTGDRPRSGQVREPAPHRAAGSSHQAHVAEEERAAHRSEQDSRTSGQSSQGGRTAQKPAEKTQRSEKNVQKSNNKKKARRDKQAARKARKNKEAVRERELDRQAAESGSSAETQNEEQPRRKLTAAELRVKYARMQRRQNWLGVLKVLAVVLVLALIIVLITVNSRKDKGVDTQYLSVGYIDDAAEGTLSFLRAEQPVYSHVSGVFIPNVNEGDRVAKNAVIGHVIKEEYADDLRDLKDIESRIAAAQRASSYIDSSRSGEVLALESAIDSGIDDLARLAMSGGLSGYSAKFNELSDLYARWGELEMNAESADTYIKDLQKQRSKIRDRIAASMHEVQAPEAGVVSFHTDGNENRVTEATQALRTRISETSFKSEMSSTLSEAELAAITLPEGTPESSSGRQVNNGTEVARIAGENDFYITVQVEDPGTHHIYPGNTAEIYAPNENIRFEAEIVGVYYCGSVSLAVLRADRGLDATVTMRRLRGTVIFSHIEGLKVPLRVLTDWDRAGLTARLTILRSGYVRYAYVNVLSNDGVYAIINNRSSLDDGSGVWVRENEEYIVNFDKVEEGQEV